MNLQQFVSRDMEPTDPAVITVAKFHAGTATNVIPDTATIEGTARTLSETARKKVRQRIRTALRGNRRRQWMRTEIRMVRRLSANGE